MVVFAPGYDKRLPESNTSYDSPNKSVGCDQLKLPGKKGASAKHLPKRDGSNCR
jgi:hypothetical protein